MGSVIKFSRRGRRSRKAPARLPNASAIVIILPVVRIERTWDAPSPIKPRSIKSTRAKPITVKSAAARQAGKSEPAGKRRKRAAAGTGAQRF